MLGTVLNVKSECWDSVGDEKGNVEGQLGVLRRGEGEFKMKGEVKYGSGKDMDVEYEF